MWQLGFLSKYGVHMFGNRRRNAGTYRRTNERTTWKHNASACQSIGPGRGIKIVAISDTRRFIMDDVLCTKQVTKDLDDTASNGNYRHKRKQDSGRHRRKLLLGRWARAPTFWTTGLAIGLSLSLHFCPTVLHWGRGGEEKGKGWVERGGEGAGKCRGEKGNGSEGREGRREEMAPTFWVKFTLPVAGRQVSSRQTAWLTVDVDRPRQSSSITVTVQRQVEGRRRRTSCGRPQRRWAADEVGRPGLHPTSFEFCSSSSDDSTCALHLSSSWETATSPNAPAANHTCR